MFSSWAPIAAFVDGVNRGWGSCCASCRPTGNGIPQIITGSGWKDYQKTGMICGIPLPVGLQEAQQLPQPLFTPSTKAAIGAHDENISYAEMEKIIAPALAAQVRDKTIQLYSEAAAYAATRGIIIADTKFEFGQDSAGKLYL